MEIIRAYDGPAFVPRGWCVWSRPRAYVTYTVEQCAPRSMRVVEMSVQADNREGPCCHSEANATTVNKSKRHARDGEQGR